MYKYICTWFSCWTKEDDNHDTSVFTVAYSSTLQIYYIVCTAKLFTVAYSSTLQIYYIVCTAKLFTVGEYGSQFYVYNIHDDLISMALICKHL